MTDNAYRCDPVVDAPSLDALRSRTAPGWRVISTPMAASRAALREAAAQTRHAAGRHHLAAAQQVGDVPGALQKNFGPEVLGTLGIDSVPTPVAAPRMHVIPGGRRDSGLKWGPLGFSVDVQGLSWQPLGWRAPVLRDIDLRIEPGEKVLLCGPSGCGKSTLLKAMAGVLEVTESGERRGRVLIGGREGYVGDGRVGLLMQNPADTRVAARVGRDVAFGPENLSMARPQIEQRVKWALNVVGFPYPENHPAQELSGGEQQRLALAGALAMRPGVLLLDEPTSMLHDAAADSTRDSILGAVKESETTLVIVEHNLTRWLPHVDRVIVMGVGGCIIADGPADQVFTAHRDRMAQDGLWVPGVARPRALDIPMDLTCPMSHLDVGTRLVTANDVRLVRRHGLGLRAVDHRTEHAALDGVSVHVNAGDFVVVRGESGSGKSSLLGVLCGLEKPTSGEVLASDAFARGRSSHPHAWGSRQLAARCGWVPQHAELAVVGTSVKQCVLATVHSFKHGWGWRVPTPGWRERVRVQRERTAAGRRRGMELLELMGMSGLADRNPHQLSGGELRRMAVVCAIAHGPDLLVLDEPTMGQDRHTWSAIAGIIASACEGGAAVVSATHDSELFNHADESMTLSRGRVANRRFHPRTDRDRSDPPFDTHASTPTTSHSEASHGLGPHLNESREREVVRMNREAHWPGLAPTRREAAALRPTSARAEVDADLDSGADDAVVAPTQLRRSDSGHHPRATSFPRRTHPTETPVHTEPSA